MVIATNLNILSTHVIKYILPYELPDCFAPVRLTTSNLTTITSKPKSRAFKANYNLLSPRSVSRLGFIVPAIKLPNPRL